MREITGIILIVIAYICIAAFILRITWRIFLLIRSPENLNRQDLPVSRIKPLTIIKTVRDVLFLTRLFRVNPSLWFAEWVFHCAFLLVMLRHLRYVMYPIPEWVISIQLAGLWAGYILPVSLIFILAIKSRIEKKGYFSSHNFFLLLLLLLISVTGILMKSFIRPDIVDIKQFILSVLMFKPVLAPKNILFIIHFITTFIFLVYLPTHIFAAPYTLLDARKREDGLNMVVHEK